MLRRAVWPSPSPSPSSCQVCVCTHAGVCLHGPCVISTHARQLPASRAEYATDERADSFTALSDSLADLEKRSARAPLLCVTDSMDEPAWRERADVASLDGSEADGERLKSSGGLGEDDWEMLG